jgi:hypothetical protein
MREPQRTPSVQVELVVDGALGELAASAFPGLVVERRQIFVASASDVLAALDQLANRNADVLLVRLRSPLPNRQ